VANKAVWDKPRPKGLGKPKELTPAKKSEAKAMAKKAGRPYPNLVDNMRAAKKADGGMIQEKQQAASSVMQDASKVGLKKGGWIQDAIKKPGALRKSLGVKQGETISKGKLKAAAKSSNPLTAKRANLAMTLRKLGK